MNLYLFISNKVEILFFAIFFLLINFLILITLIYLGKKNFFKIHNKLKNNIQKIHKGNISRLGGMSIVITSFISSWFYLQSNNNLYILILLFGLPLIIVALMEDIFQHLNPIFRLSSIVISSVLYLTFAINDLPLLDIYLINQFINTPVMSVIFYTLCLVAYINGVNFIDGTNGLAGFTVLSSLLSLLFVALLFKDIEIAQIIFYFIFILIAFLLLNYPFGKIFLGDLGAYFLGWFTGIMTILIMSRNPEIPNWNAVCILSYPIIEVIFSFIRKIYNKRNPFYPDKEHLHLKLFFTLSGKINNPIIANSLVVPFLASIWMMPLVVLPWIYLNKFMIFTAIIIQIIMYYLFYIAIPEE